MRFVSLFILLTVCYAGAIYSIDDELHLVRKITDSWQDKEYRLVKKEIQEFKDKYPNSNYSDSLMVLLGDLLWQEKDYEGALTAYDEIRTVALQEKIFSQCLDCAYHLGNYEQLLRLENQIVMPGIKPHNSQQELWTYYYLEALFLQAKNEKEFSKTLLNKALSYCQSLEGTSQHFNSQLIRSDILCLKGDPLTACEIYTQLAETYPEKKEELMLTVGCLQTDFDPQAALSSFEQVIDIGGPHISDAALNKAITLFQTAQYARIIQDQKRLRNIVDKEKRRLLEWVIAKSYYALNEYACSAQLLRPLLTNCDEEDEKTILLTLISCLYHLNQAEEMQPLIERFESKYDDPESLAEIRFLEALTLKNSDQYDQAQCKLEEVLKKFPEFVKAENVEFELASLKYKQGQWAASRLAFLAFAQKYSDSKFYPTALQHIVGTSFKIQEENSSPILKKLLAADLKLALNTPGILSDAQKSQYLLRLGKTLYETECHLEAIDTLKAYLDTYPQEPNAYQAHLLTALCYHEGLNDDQNFAAHAEQVLKLNPNYAQKDLLHLDLFALYFHTDPAKSAEHLWQAYKSGKQELMKQEYLVWLANYYYVQVRGSSNDYLVESLQSAQQINTAHRAIEIYHAIIDKNQVSLSQEGGLYKLSNLYGWLNRRNEQIKILRALIRTQMTIPESDYDLHSRTLFAFAYALQSIGDHSQALNAYQYIIATPFQDPFILSASKLQLARLAFAALPEHDRSLENHQMVAILNLFKDLQLQKKLSEEPIHIEAALDYAQIRASLEPKERQAQQHYLLLTKVKEEFTNNQDLWSKNYQAQRKLRPEKEALYQGYMLLLEAELASLEGNIQKNPIKIETATALYSKLLEEHSEKNSYLISSAKLGLEAVNP